MPTSTALSSAVPVVHKSEADTRSYRYITLESNNLPALLISDPESEKSAAALDVQVGSFTDPEELPGLAHFCEHMLFLGTEKYPDENEYAEYLAKHGGSSNAYTAAEHTNYFFDVTAPNFKGALDIFAQFFISPLFTESCVDRELNAIESEHKKNLQSDAWRKMQLLKTISDPSHPYHKFSTGDLRTLRDEPAKRGIDTRKALLDFHSKYYSASNMRLCVLGTESLDELEKLVKESFQDVKDNGVAPPDYSKEARPWIGKSITEDDTLSALYPALQSSVDAGRLIKTVPIMEKRVLELQFMAPPVKDKYDTKPASFYGAVLGHEGTGSILQLLKTKGWANELWAGQGQSTTDFSIFTVHIDLSKEGISHLPEITRVILDYIALLKNDVEANGCEQHARLWQEMASIENIKFRFKPQPDPMNYTSGIASGMHTYKPEDCVRGGALFLNYDQSELSTYLKFLSEDNMQAIVVDKAFEKEQDWDEEKWYRTLYNIEQLYQIPASSPLSEQIHLPPPNNFIADDFSIYALPGEVVDQENPTKTKWKDTNVPELVFEDAGLRIYHKQDDVFRKPKSVLKMYVRTSTIFESAYANCALQLYIHLVDDALNVLSYDASLAGLHYSVQMGDEAITIALSGYNQKLPVLADAVTKVFTNVDQVLDETRFKARKEELMDLFANFKKGAPYRVAMYHLGACYKQPSFSYKEMLAACESITMDSLREFASKVHEKSKVEALVCGNIQEQDAINLVKDLKQTLFHSTKEHTILCDEEVPSPRCVSLPLSMKPTTHRYTLPKSLINQDEPNSCLLMSWQIGPRRVETRALRMMLSHLMKEPAFDQLRTKEQLGYIVFTYGTYRYGVDFIEMIVQSEKSPRYLEDRVEAFLESYAAKLDEMTEEEFQKHLDAVVTNLTKKPKRISEMTSIWAGGVKNMTYTFHLRDEIEAQLRNNVTKDAVKQFFNARIARTGGKRRLFTVYYLGTSAGEDKESGDIVEHVENAQGWQASMPLYPAEKKLAHQSKL